MLVVGGWGRNLDKWGPIESTEVMLSSGFKKWRLVPGKTPKRFLLDTKLVTLDNTLYMIGKRIK